MGFTYFKYVSILIYTYLFLSLVQPLLQGYLIGLGYFVLKRKRYWKKLTSYYPIFYCAETNLRNNQPLEILLTWFFLLHYVQILSFLFLELEKWKELVVRCNRRNTSPNEKFLKFRCDVIDLK